MLSTPLAIDKRQTEWAWRRCFARGVGGVKPLVQDCWFKRDNVGIHKLPVQRLVAESVHLRQPNDRISIMMAIC